MTAPDLEISECANSHQRLAASVRQLVERDLRRPSLLPGWTIAHVLTHLARNADSIVRRLDGARDGQVVAQYEGGAGGRGQQIADGAARSADAIVADVVETNAAVDAAFASFPADAWDRTVEASGGTQRVGAHHLAYSRWREVEIHHVDLGGKYTADDWPPTLVHALTPSVMAGLPARADPTQLLAWALGRGEPPRLTPWG